MRRGPWAGDLPGDKDLSASRARQDDADRHGEPEHLLAIHPAEPHAVHSALIMVLACAFSSSNDGRRRGAVGRPVERRNDRRRVTASAEPTSPDPNREITAAGGAIGRNA
jgi:hypothetical protein